MDWKWLGERFPFSLLYRMEYKRRIAVSRYSIKMLCLNTLITGGGGG